MKKFEILKAVADFAQSCEANGVDLFYYYNPYVNKLTIYVYNNGKYSIDGQIDFSQDIYFNDKNPWETLKITIESIIDKYYGKV
jgi:hypothetical protein